MSYSQLVKQYNLINAKLSRAERFGNDNLVARHRATLDTLDFAIDNLNKAF